MHTWRVVSGSAAGKQCRGAIGSQTGGSIAPRCGSPDAAFVRVGYFRALSTSGSLDHPGPMVYSVEDLAILLAQCPQPSCRLHRFRTSSGGSVAAECCRPRGRRHWLFERHWISSRAGGTLPIACPRRSMTCALPSGDHDAELAGIIETHWRHASVICHIRSLIEEGLRGSNGICAQASTAASGTRGCVSDVDARLPGAGARDGWTTGIPSFNAPGVTPTAHVRSPIGLPPMACRWRSSSSAS